MKTNIALVVLLCFCTMSGNALELKPLEKAVIVHSPTTPDLFLDDNTQDGLSDNGGQRSGEQDVFNILEVKEEPKTLLLSSDLSGSGTEADPYRITSAEEMFQLAEDVKAGNSYTDQFIELYQDITLLDWTPIGGFFNDNPRYFSGLFYGNGHTIEVELSAPNASYIGLFGMTNGARISGITVIGSISGSQETGGVVGSATSTTLINCHNQADVQGEFASVGGVAGSCSGSIQQCSNMGSITAASNTNHIGGIVGLQASGVIRDCWNTGQVSGYSSLGGIVGHLQNANAENCYSTGIITAQDTAGGIVGKAIQSSLSNNYYLEHSVIGIAGESQGVTELSADQMQSQAFARQLGESYGYSARYNDGYPVLRSNHSVQTSEILVPQAEYIISKTGEPVPIGIICTGDNTLVFESNAPDVAVIGADQTVQALVPGRAQIIISAAATDFFETPAPKTVSILIKDTLIIEELPNASTITYRQTLSKSKLTGGKVAGTTGAWAWVEPNLKPNAGTAEFAVVFTPDSSEYAPITAEVTLTVNKYRIDPEYADMVVYPSYGELTYGQRLDSLTFADGFVSSVSGVWAWVEPDYKPDAGLSLQGVVYLPDDTANIEPFYETLYVNVHKATPLVIGVFASNIIFGQELRTAIIQSTIIAPLLVGK